MPSEQVSPNKIKQILFLSILILLFLILFKELYFFLPSLLGAITLYIILRKWMITLCVKRKFKRWAAALVLLIISFVAFVFPMVWIFTFIVNAVRPLLHNPYAITTILDKMNQYIQAEWKLDIMSSTNISQVSSYLLSIAQSMLGGTFNAVGNIAVMYLLLYFLLAQNVEIELWLRKNIPFKPSNVQKFILEFRNLVFSNAIGIPIVAVIQGIIGLIGYWIFGVDNFFLMSIFTAICSVIPMVGSTLVWLPLGIYMIAIGHQGSGIGILLWGGIVIGSIDNVARFILQKKIADVHPLVTIFGVIVGVSLFGFIGLVFGPLLLSMFFLLVKIYLDEYGQKQVEST